MPRSKLICKAMPWIAAIISGILYFLGYAGFDRFYLGWICLVPLLWAIREQRPVRALFIGWVAGIVTNIGGFYWIIGMFREFAGMAWPLSFLGLLFLAVANGFLFAFWAYATRFIICSTGWGVAWVAPVVWTAAEKLWPEIFPNYLGAGQYQLSILTQIADVTGILGVSFIIVYINSSLYEVIEQWRRNRRLALKRAILCTVVILAVLSYGALRVRTVDRDAATAGRLTAGLIQTNRGAGEKRFDPVSLLREHQEMSGELLAAHPVDLIVWPESVCGIERMSREGKLPPGVLHDLRTPVLFGSVLRLWQAESPSLYNSAVLADGSGEIMGTYDKMVLVPFGEYIPFGETFPRLYSWLPFTGRFRPGENIEPLRFGEHYLSVSICYEDIFPGHIRSLMRGGNGHHVPEAMFNLTNDSWYGKTVEPMEHLALASFRAIEHRRPLVRATNTGISAFVDPAGRIVKRSGLWTRETLAGSVPLMHGRTVYALLGDWLGWLCTIITLIGAGRALVITGRRKRPEHGMCK